MLNKADMHKQFQGPQIACKAPGSDLDGLFSFSSISLYQVLHHAVTQQNMCWTSYCRFVLPGHWSNDAEPYLRGRSGTRMTPRSQMLDLTAKTST